MVYKAWLLVVNLFNYSEKVYLNNAKYFISLNTRRFFENEGIRVINILIYLASLVGLIEKMVKLIKEALKK